jgi:hypothetical protein
MTESSCCFQKCDSDSGCRFCILVCLRFWSDYSSTCAVGSWCSWSVSGLAGWGTQKAGSCLVLHSSRLLCTGCNITMILSDGVADQHNWSLPILCCMFEEIPFQSPWIFFDDFYLKCVLHVQNTYIYIKVFLPERYSKLIAGTICHMLI